MAEPETTAEAPPPPADASAPPQTILYHVDTGEPRVLSAPDARELLARQDATGYAEWAEVGPDAPVAAEAPADGAAPDTSAARRKRAPSA